MVFEKEILPGLWHISLKSFSDMRGTFVKTFSDKIFREHGIECDWKEEFYSFSKCDVIRGMHFQVPPCDHMKLVYCPKGAVMDVMLDLRSGPGYGRVVSVELHDNNPSVLIMPTGIAHGFRSLADDTLMIYKTTTEHNLEFDRGIRWDSFDFNWALDSPIVSPRDQGHPKFADYYTPF